MQQDAIGGNQIVQNSVTSNGTLKSSTQPWKIDTTA